MFVLAVLIFVAGFVITGRVEQTVQTKLREAGFETKSVSVSLLSRSIEIDSLVYATGQSIPNAHKGFIKKVKAGNFHVIAFLQRKEIIIGNVVLQQGNIAYNKNYKIKKDSTSKQSDQEKIKGIKVKYLSISDFSIALLNDTIPENSIVINDFELGDFDLTLADTTYSIGWIEADLQNLKMAKKGGLHAFGASKIVYDSRDKSLEVDSFRIFSPYNKEEFARVARIQKTRLDITLPKIMFEGLDQDRFFTDSVLAVKRIIIPKPVVHAYRDKRYPFVRDWIMPLPIEGIRRLPFKLSIDSILISQADIAYEEFSEKGLPATGTITFNKLDASFAGLTTELDQPDKKAFCTLVADCKVMNSGILHATFKMPLNSTVNYEAFGNVRQMDLKSLNPSLGNLSRIEIADGTLNDLRFNFSYNDNVSTGEVLINYKELKLQALKKDKKAHEVNKVLSGAINAIVKSDKDKTVDKSKRTGVIDIERDKKRFVFQFWWKSLLDGLQSTFINNGKKKKAKRPSK